MNAFSLDITKVLQATEIIKTRTPFLHQENKLISSEKEITIKSKKDDEPDQTTMRMFSGISVILSRNPLEGADPACYQKPKPRQFVQPAPRQKVEDRESEPAPRDDKKKRPRKPKADRAQSSHSDDRDRKAGAKNHSVDKQ